MKYVVCVPDGCADEPIDALGGRTPLEAAKMPVLSALAARGEVGRAAVIPKGLPPGSDVGNMSIIGYDPAAYHTGRAPIEAAALGLRLRPDQVAYRCNLVTVGDDGTMLDFAGGVPVEVVAARRSSGRPVVRLDRTVERGAPIEVERDALPPTEQDEYYAFELVGLTVMEENGRELGSVKAVTNGVANDVLELDSGVLLPMIEDCVREVDLSGGRILVAEGFTVDD